MIKHTLHKILLSFVIILFAFTPYVQAAMRPHLPEDFPASVMYISALANVKVLRNDVTIDFRKNSKLPPNSVTVNLVYEIDCTHASASPQSITFVLGDIYEHLAYTFEFDGQAIGRDTILTDSLNMDCLYPDSVQWKDAYLPYYFSNSNINNDKYIDRRVGNNIPFVIKNISQGQHIIKISYVAHLSSWFTHDDLSEYQSFIHLFQPEQNPWQSFNNLHLNFIVPKDCEYFASINMEQKEVTNDAVHLYAYWDEVPQGDYVSLVLHKDESNAIITAWVFVILAALMIVGLCLFGLIKVVRKTLVSERENTGKVLFINYITAIFSLFVEYCMLLFIDEPLWWYLSLLMLVIAACIVAYYYPKKRLSRKVLYYLNTLAYGIAILIAAYLLLSFDFNGEGTIFGIAFIILILVELQTVAKYSTTRRLQKKLLRVFNNLMFIILFAIVITICLYLILFGYDAIIHKMMAGFIQPNAHVSGMVIIVAPIIFTIAFIALRIVKYLTVRVIKYKQKKRLSAL